MRALRKLKLVESDVAEAAECYEARRPGLGVEFISIVEKAGAQIQGNPFRSAVAFADIRRMGLGRFPYAIFFLLDEETIVGLGVLHHRRDTQKILGRRRLLVKRENRREELSVGCHPRGGAEWRNRPTKPAAARQTLRP